MLVDQLRFDGKNVLIIGAGGRGMGTTTTRGLVDLGANVIAVDRTEALLQELRDDLGGVGFVGIAANVLEAGAIERAVMQAIESVGEIHCLANVAGGTAQNHWCRAENYPADVYDTVMALNVRYVFMACRDVAKHMIVSGIRGSIVNFGSVSGFAAAPYHAPYGAAKAAVAALTRSLATEWGPVGIRVNAVNPGSVRTRRTLQHGTDSEDFASTWAPLGRYSDPEEVSGVAIFLLSDAASTVTGQIVNVDAGVSAHSGVSIDSPVAWLD